MRGYRSITVASVATQTPRRSVEAERESDAVD